MVIHHESERRDLPLRLSGVTGRRGHFSMGPISLKLPKGVHALVGPNGSGKSTLFHTIAGTLRTLRGDITIDGHPLSRRGRREAMRALGFLAQDPHTSSLLQVKQSVAYAAWLKDVPKHQAARFVEHALVAVDLQELAHKRVGQLSGGQRQRVGLAQASVHQPALLLLDEPTTYLDPRQRSGLYSVILGLAREGKTVVISTHNLEDVAALADSMLIMESGRIITHVELSPRGAPADRHSEVSRTAAEHLGYST